MAVKLSQNVEKLTPSATMAVASRARELRAEGREVIDLSAGEPDFPTPEAIAEAGIDAIRRGSTRYTAPAGLPELRRAIAETMANATGRETDPSGVVVTSGAKQALFNACFTLFGPGDRVLLPTPYWTTYPAIVELARAEPVEVRGEPDRGFKVTVDDLDAAHDERVRGLILNSPCNPSGAVYSRDELEAIARWARERDVRLISDEIYGRITFTGERAPGLLDLDEQLPEGSVVVDGASKVFAMTGWRIGFSYTTDPELTGRLSALQSQTTSNANTPAQHAAIAAFRREPLEHEAVRTMVDTFGDRRDLVLTLFDEHLPDVRFVRPDGAFYFFFRVDPFYSDEAPDSIALCRTLLEEAGVALVPGAAFGADDYVRLSFAAAEDELARGIPRAADALSARRAL